MKYSFVFVRHPVTRIISWYNHLLKHLYFEDLKTNELNDKSESYKYLKNNYKMYHFLFFQLLTASLNLNL
jgi:hypothetical protein